MDAILRCDTCNQIYAEMPKTGHNAHVIHITAKNLKVVVTVWRPEKNI